MKSLRDIKKIIASHKNELKNRFNVSRIGLFGSYVRGDNTRKSDLDVYVEFSKPIGWEIVDLHEYLKSLVNIKIDLATKGAVAKKKTLWKSIQEDLVNV